MATFTFKNKGRIILVVKAENITKADQLFKTLTNGKDPKKHAVSIQWA